MFDLVAETNRLLARAHAREKRKVPQSMIEPDEMICTGCDQNWGPTDWHFCPECGGELASQRELREQLADDWAERRLDWEEDDLQ